ncbi:Very-long-chain enoyl-CoA reductase [Channa argus]|uniref:Very-long-chain enoyl-CoA reductase n=1 Tax=Channa argus TaxID=215402 RepID=A0A6G1QM91_CHAAH|nr:Very-long-chain enoyl-CoA reductase [Channa argus]
MSVKHTDSVSSTRTKYDELPHPTEISDVLSSDRKKIHSGPVLGASSLLNKPWSGGCNKTFIMAATTTVCFTICLVNEDDVTLIIQIEMTLPAGKNSTHLAVGPPRHLSLRVDSKSLLECFGIHFYLEGKSLRDDEVLQNLPVGTTATMYFRDLGPQLGWTMVFLAEYVGPLLIYLFFYFRVPYMYLHRCAFTSSPHPVVKLACECHTFHYLKRLIETIFVHRFSHGTMPLRTIVRNCAYYWGFSGWLAYYINHPLYTPPCWSLGELHHHDPVPASGIVHSTGVHPDDRLGQREAQSLQQGVQGLSQLPDGHYPPDSLTVLEKDKTKLDRVLQLRKLLEVFIDEDMRNADRFQARSFINSILKGCLLQAPTKMCVN